MHVSIDPEHGLPFELELLLAQELAVAQVAKSVRFLMEPTEDEWTVSSGGPRPLPTVSGIHLLKADSTEDRRSYIEKRLAVLCARAFATMLILGRKAHADGKDQNPDQFWRDLTANGDRSRAAELCTAYLIEDANKSQSSYSDSDLAKKHNEYIRLYGLQTVAEVLTEREFLSVVDACPREFNQTTGRLTATIRTEQLERYSPGLSTIKIMDIETSADVVANMPTDLSLSWGEHEDNDQRHYCLVAHELGHWLAAQYVEMPTSGVEFDWKKYGDSCTVHLGLPALEWSLVRYLSARITVLCAGSYADCWMRYPKGRPAIGHQFYMNLLHGTGTDDFAKLTELYVLYRTMLPSPPVRGGPTAKPSSDEILESLIMLLKEGGLYQALQSPEFEALVARICGEAEQASIASTNGPSTFVEFKTEALLDACTKSGLSLKA